MTFDIFQFIECKVRPPQSLLGLDIGSSAIKAALLQADAEGLTVQGLWSERLPHQTVTDRNIKDPDKVLEALRRLHEKIRTTLKKGAKTVFPSAISMGGNGTISKVLAMPVNLQGRDLKLQVDLEAERYIPFPLDEAYFDFYQRSDGEEPNKQDIQIAATKKNLLDVKLDLCAAASFKVEVVDVDQLLYERILRFLKSNVLSSGAMQRVALLDIGATLNKLVVLDKERISFYREQPFGSHQLLTQVQNRYGLSLEESIEAIRLGRWPEDFQVEVVQPFQDAVVQQMKRALQYYSSSENQGPLDLLFISGGASNLQGLEGRIRDSANCKVLPAEFFLSARLAPFLNENFINQEGATFVEAAGLALRNNQ